MLPNLSFLWVLYFWSLTHRILNCGRLPYLVSRGQHRGHRLSSRRSHLPPILSVRPSARRIKRERKKVSFTSFVSLPRLMCLSKKQKRKKTGFFPSFFFLPLHMIYSFNLVMFSSFFSFLLLRPNENWNWVEDMVEIERMVVCCTTVQAVGVWFLRGGIVNTSRAWEDADATEE